MPKHAAPAAKSEIDQIIESTDEPGSDPLTSEEAAQALVDQLAAEDGEETGTQTQEPANGDGGKPELEGEIDLSLLPPDLRATAETYYGKEKSLDLEALLGGRHAMPQQAQSQPVQQSTEAKPVKYTVVIPDDIEDVRELRPFLQQFADEFGGRADRAEARVAELERQLRVRDQQSGEQQFEETIEKVVEKYGVNTFKRIMPGAMKHLQEAPGMGSTVRGIRKAFSMAFTELALVQQVARERGAMRSGPVRQTRAVSTTSSAEPKPQKIETTRDAVRAAARQMKQMGMALPDGF